MLKFTCILAFMAICFISETSASCGGDPNAQSGCGTFCNRCDNYKSKAKACPLFCKLNGCDCMPNYVYDSTTKNCILPKDCPTTPPPTT